MRSRILRGFFVVTGAMFLVACTSIPITSLYKLYKLDPFDIDPQEFRLIIRAHEAISVRKGNVTMGLGFKAHDDSLVIDDTYIVDIERNGSLPAEVLDDKGPNEAFTLLKLSEADARQLTETQRLLKPYIEKDDSGDGSFAININNVCLTKALPEGKSLLTVYMQSDVEDGFFVFLNNLDMRKKRKDIDGSIDDIPVCADLDA
ncbi:hypothetical protein EYS14_19685 [Alteromonadaceae bacterium M269]|nr:hypothetical protein EYS14_19685 [Alteromonadaceae bacterium M269]